MTKPTITIEDIIAYHEERAEIEQALSDDCMEAQFDAHADMWKKRAAAHREAAALLRKGLDE